MAFSAVSVIRGSGEIAAMVVEVTKIIFTRPFQFREFVEQAWFITSVTLIMASIGSIAGAVVGGPRRSLEQYGDQLMFYVKALAWTPRAIRPGNGSTIN